MRIGRRRPADGVGVDAGVAVGAAAGGVDVLDAQLHRRNRGLLAVALRVELVERRADVDVGALRLLRVLLGEEHRAGAEVIAADLGQFERLGVAHVGVADDGQVLAQRFEGQQAGRRQVEGAAGGRRRPHVLLQPDGGGAGRAVHHLDAGQPDAAGGGPGQRGARRDHRLEERQGDGGPQPLQRGAPRQVLLRDEHPESRLRVRALIVTESGRQAAGIGCRAAPCQCLAPAATGAVVVASGSSARLMRKASLATTPCTKAVTL